MSEVVALEPDFIQVFVKSLQGQTIVVDVTSQSTVATLKDKLFDRTGVKVEEMRLLHAGKEIGNKDEATLNDLGVVNESNIFMVLRLRGGTSTATRKKTHPLVPATKNPRAEKKVKGGEQKDAKIPAQNNEPKKLSKCARRNVGKRAKKKLRRQLLKQSQAAEMSAALAAAARANAAPAADAPKVLSAGNGLQLTTVLPDLITLETDGDPRAIMPCGHAIGPDSLTQLMRSIIVGNSKPEVRCPSPQENVRARELCLPNVSYTCDEEWPYPLCRRVAMLSKEERELFEIKMSQNRVFHDWKTGVECPKCKSVIVCDNRDIVRIHCVGCQKINNTQIVRHFCRQCLQPWKLPNNEQFCGNNECKSTTILEGALMTLRATKRKTIYSIPNVPVTRACPRPECLRVGIRLYDHLDGCSHLTCKQCHLGFCAACLGVKTPDEIWLCSGFEDHHVAPIQTAAQLTT